MPRNSVAIRLGTEGKQQVKADFTEIGQSGSVTAERLRAKWEAETAAIGRATERAAQTAQRISQVSEQTPMQMRVNQAVSTGFGDPRNSAAASAAFFQDMDNRARSLLATLDPLIAAQ